MFACHRFDTGRVQESIRARKSDATVIFDKEEAMGDCRNLSNGILTAREGVARECIDRAWVQREAPFPQSNGKFVAQFGWTTKNHRRAKAVRICCYFGTVHKGHHVLSTVYH